MPKQIDKKKIIKDFRRLIALHRKKARALGKLGDYESALERSHFIFILEAVLESIERGDYDKAD